MAKGIHLTRHDRDHVVCVDCGRPIRRGPSGDPSSWVHASKRGRPPAAPTDERQAGRSAERWLAADHEITTAALRRDEAFRAMVDAGMTTYQIAQATGLGDGSVRYKARRLGIEPRRVAVRPSTTRVVERLARKGSILFGD